MDLITIDFETYYDKQFSLRKLTTEQYIRDDLFEVIGVGVKVNNGETKWVSGDYDEINSFLHTLNWADAMVVAHNNMFDGAILNWHYGIRPRVYMCTMYMARGLHGVEAPASLAMLAKRYRLQDKGTAVLDALGKRREDFTEKELADYGDYCIGDVDICYQLFKKFAANFPKVEMQLIDLTLRMFVEPKLTLDSELLELHLKDVKARKNSLLRKANMSREDLLSNPKFAEVLLHHGVAPPMKVSPTTGKQTYALAKTDKDFLELLEHPKLEVQALVNARLGTKSTLEETRTQRFLDIADRGTLPVPIRYYAAHTGRWGGADKINMQNLPSRGPDGKFLKRSICAPEGYMLIDCDSSQIEARVLAWLAGQDDLCEAFARGEDVYKKMASSIYNVPVEEVTKEQRFVGKTAILGAGYGMGAVRFKDQLKAQAGVDVTADEARRIIQVYRNTNWKIAHFWRACQDMLKQIANKGKGAIGTNKLLSYAWGSSYKLPLIGLIKLPSGLMLRYEDLAWEQGERGVEFTYATRKSRTRIYGGKVTENVCQALARCIIGEQMIAIAKKYDVVMTVHDSIVCCVPEKDVEEGQRYIEHCMRIVPDWCEGLPLDCESGVGKSYGECE